MATPDERTRLLPLPGHIPESQASTIPWLKRRSPWWILSIIPLARFASMIVVAPKIDLFREVVCEALGQVVGDACTAHPQVQKTVAQLVTADAATAGVLSCLTTAVWASLSDKHGRKLVLLTSGLGTLLSLIVFILVAQYWLYLPGKYWWFMLGPVLEGVLGGATVTVVGWSAYIADTTTELNRSRFLTLSLGAQFSGLALGPVVGGLAVKYSGSLLVAFHMSAALQVVYILSTLVIPESLVTRAAERPAEAARDSDTRSHLSASRRVANKLVSVVEPFKMLLPRKVDNPSGVQSYDWTATLVATSYSFLCALGAGFMYLIQYATHEFNWTSEENGYWLTTLLSSRALFLLVLLPALLLFVKSPNPSPDLPKMFRKLGLAPSHVPASLGIDLALTKVYIMVEMFAYAVMLCFASPSIFYVLAVLTSFASGLPPALESMAVSMYGGTEVGKLLGALNILQSFLVLVVSPALFGFVYITFLSIFPKAIFVLSFSGYSLSLLALTLAGRHLYKNATYQSPVGSSTRSS